MTWLFFAVSVVAVVQLGRIANCVRDYIEIKMAGRKTPDW